jgi:hypothetical protein
MFLKFSESLEEDESKEDSLLVLNIFFTFRFSAIARISGESELTKILC